jgi:hypothetical protein
MARILLLAPPTDGQQGRRMRTAVRTLTEGTKP